MSVFDKVYFGLLIICLFCYIITFRKTEKYKKPVIAILLLWLVTTSVAIYLSMYAGIKNNLFIFHIATPVEYVLLILLYRYFIVNATAKKIFAVSIPVFVAASIIFSIFIQPPVVNNSYITIAESIIIIFVSLLFLREILLLQQIKVLHQFPMFWISVAILFYYTGTLIIEGMLNYLISHSLELARRVYRMSYFMKYLLFILFIIGAFCERHFFIYTKKIR
jgi:hypothetical protein